jgi:hypothetical protein
MRSSGAATFDRGSRHDRGQHPRVCVQPRQADV